MTPLNLPIRPSVVFPTSLLIPADFDYRRLIEETLGTLDDSKTSYWKYDAAIADWLRRVFLADGVSVPVIPSAPQNAVANYKKLLTELGYLGDCPGNTNNFSSLPLPLVTVFRSGDDVRTDASRINLPINNLGPYVQPGKVGGFTRYPKPMWFTYQINLWARNKSHFSWLRQMFEMLFTNKVTWIRVAHGPLPTKYRTAIWRESFEDQSSFQRDESEELILRGVYTVKVEAWMWDPIFSAPLILKHTTDEDGVENSIEFIPGQAPVANTSREAPFEFV